MAIIQEKVYTEGQLKLTHINFVILNSYVKVIYLTFVKNTFLGGWKHKIWMNCFCCMVDRRKAFSLISIQDHCQRSSASRISDTPRAGFEPAQNLSSGLVEWSCAVVITNTTRRTGWNSCIGFFSNKIFHFQKKLHEDMYFQLQ